MGVDAKRMASSKAADEQSGWSRYCTDLPNYGYLPTCLGVYGYARYACRQERKCLLSGIVQGASEHDLTDTPEVRSCDEPHDRIFAH